MPPNTWRQEWPAHRVHLIDITARHFVNGQARASRGDLPTWNELTPEHQSNFCDNVAAVFIAQAQAFAEIEAMIGDDEDSGTAEWGYNVERRCSHQGGESMTPPLGRPSKGPRDSIMIRPSPELGALLRSEGRRNSMTAGEHVVALLAQHFKMPRFAPEPSLRNPDRYPTRPRVTRGRDTIQVRPPIEFGRLIKERARDSGLSYGAYVVALVEGVLYRQDDA